MKKHQKKKKITTFPVGNQSTGFGRANKWGGVKLVDTLIYNNTWFLVFMLQKLLNYLAFQPFDFERTWWRLFQKRVVHTRLDIYVFNEVHICCELGIKTKHIRYLGELFYTLSYTILLFLFIYVKWSYIFYAAQK